MEANNIRAAGRAPDFALRTVRKKPRRAKLALFFDTRLDIPNMGLISPHYGLIALRVGHGVGAMELAMDFPRGSLPHSASEKALHPIDGVCSCWFLFRHQSSGGKPSGRL